MLKTIFTRLNEKGVSNFGEKDDYLAGENTCCRLNRTNRSRLLLFPFALPGPVFAFIIHIITSVTLHFFLVLEVILFPLFKGNKIKMK